MGYKDLSAFQSPRLQRIIRGLRRIRGEADTRERHPITKDLLLRILHQIDRNTREGATLYAAFYLAFAAFLRVGEFTYSAKDLKDPKFSQWFLTRRSVTLHKDHLELTLPASKTDPFRRGITLSVAASGGEYFEQNSTMSQSLARKRSSPSLSRHESDISGVSLREGKNPAVRSRRYQQIFESVGIYMGQPEPHLRAAQTDKALCQELLKKEHPVPKDSLFNDDLFESTCKDIANRNEARVIQDIGRLIVPAPEELFRRGAKHLSPRFISGFKGYLLMLATEWPRRPSRTRSITEISVQKAHRSLNTFPLRYLTLIFYRSSLRLNAARLF